MKFNFIVISILLILSSCGNESKEDPKPEPKDDTMTREDSLTAKKDSLEIESNYDLSTVDAKNQAEFIENLKKIEDKYGTQWDFCTCVVKQDSIDKAIKDVSLSDADFDKVIARSDVVDEKCQAFLSQSASQTPDDRADHEDKVRKCLKAAGISQ